MTLASVPRYDPGAVSRLGDRAVVVGGSIAGLVAARVLADGFREVQILERDPVPDGPTARDGAPQSSHPHVLLEGGRATLEDLLPGFGDRLLGAGGLLVDSGRDMTYYDEGGYLADPDRRLPTYSATRALIEHVVRERVLTHEAVTIRGETQVTGYSHDERGERVTGVTLRDGAGEGEAQLGADLVVDASGRTSRTPAWLAANSYQTPPVDEVTVDVTYSSARIERPPGDRRVFLVPPSAPRTRGAALVPVEDGQWELILQDMHGEGSPADRESVQDFLVDLPVPDLARVVRDHDWASPEIARYPFPASRRRRYDALESFPDRLVVTGDAVASFNPVYGQGMSVAALEALQLHHTLAADGLDAVGPRFFDRTAPVVDDVWQLAVGADFAFAGTSGEKPVGTDVVNRYVARLLRRAQDDPTLAEAFMRVTRLERSPSSLFHPSVAWRVLRPRLGRSSLPGVGQGSAVDSTAADHPVEPPVQPQPASDSGEPDHVARDPAPADGDGAATPN